MCQMARETLECVRELAPDVLLLDWELPDTDILFLLRQLRRRQETHTVLLVDGVRSEDLTDAASLGASAALDRNVDAGVVVRCVHSVVEGEYWFQRGLTRALLDAVPDAPKAGRAGMANAGGRLTPRETDVMQAVARGKTNREIAGELKLSEHTVKQHLKQVFGKLDVSSRVELVLRIAKPSRPPLQ
jgi:two-component system nitrate/nitrite response regulator NarL